MQEDNLVGYRNPGIALPVADALTEVLRRGARELLQQAVEAEVVIKKAAPWRPSYHSGSRV